MQVTDIGSAKTGQDQSTGPSRQKPIATLYEAILALDLKYDELVREKKRLVDLQAAVLLAPAIVALLGDLRLPARYRQHFPLQDGRKFMDRKFAV